jgi:SAM-dependent methyltransferase
MWEQDKAETTERYLARWRLYGYDPRTLGWNKDCQWVRFAAAFEGLQEDEYSSILDIGCGFGDLLQFLRLRGWAGRYIGVDLVPELIREAAARHANDPDAEFVSDDGESYAPAQPCDLAIAVGVFNHRVKQGNLDFIRAMVGRMWQSSSRVLVCDFLSTSSDVERRQPNLYYADPQEIFALASSYSRRIQLHHAYMPFEFQVKIWRDDSFTVAQPVFAPYSHMARGQKE